MFVPSFIVLGVFGIVTGQANDRLPAPTTPRFELPVGYWSFDLCEACADQTVVQDETADGRGGSCAPTDARLSAGAACTNGRYGTAGSFDGGDGGATIVAGDGRYDFTTALTISAWVRPSAVNGPRTIAGKWMGPDSYILMIQDGVFVFGVALNNGGNVVYRTVSGGAAAANTWTHVAGVLDGADDKIKLFVDGAQVSGSPQSIPGGAVLQESSQAVVIGNWPPWNAFQGRIDEVRLYADALSSAQIRGLAAAPGLPVRGLHLISDIYLMRPADPEHENIEQNYWRAQFIGNLSSVKASIFSCIETGVGYTVADCRAYQRNELTRLKASLGNHVTYVLRAWPVGSDFGGPPVDHYERGRAFAHQLESVFYHLRFDLKMQNVYIEVGNEPNLANERFTDANGLPSPDAYNNFFRGFYFGEREIGYDFPLVYAGLSPAPTGGDDSDVWYQNPFVLAHIRDYAAKIGAHVYWASGQRGSDDGSGGKYYRRIRNYMINGGVSPRGIIISEFNARRSTFGSSARQRQIDDACTWWREEHADANAGWWVEQALIYVSDSDNAADRADYTLAHSQLDEIRDCR